MSTRQEHRRIVEDFCAFLSGQTAAYTRRIEREMKAAAAELDYERAARLRDDLRALERALEKNAVVLGDGTDADVVGIADDELEAAVQVFHVRGGRIRGQRGFVVEKVEDARPRRTSSSTCSSSSTATSRPTPSRARCSCPALPTDVEAAVTWLSRAARERRSTSGCRSAATSTTCSRP